MTRRMGEDAGRWREREVGDVAIQLQLRYHDI